jgi:hypothetical protein
MVLSMLSGEETKGVIKELQMISFGLSRLFEWAITVLDFYKLAWEEWK